jgi:hypothetical protein
MSTASVVRAGCASAGYSALRSIRKMPRGSSDPIVAADRFRQPSLLGIGEAKTRFAASLREAHEKGKRSPTEWQQQKVSVP